MMKKIAGVLLILVLVVTMFAGCSNPSKQIVGTWTYSQKILGTETSASYTFNADGTGKTSGILGTELSITYTITDDQLTINSTVLGTTTSSTYTMKIEKNTMTLTDADDTIVLTKQA